MTGLTLTQRVRLSLCTQTLCAHGWQAGFGMTDIDPLWHPSPRGRAMFDVGSVAQADGEAIQRRIAPVLANLLLASAGMCTGLCQVRTLALKGTRVMSGEELHRRIQVCWCCVLHGARCASWPA